MKPTRPMRLRPSWIVCSLLASAAAHAQPRDADPSGPSTAKQTADAGGFSPWSMAARSDTQRGLAHVVGGYDGAKKGAMFESLVEARLTGPL